MIKLKLWRIENCVLMKILEQDEKTRGEGVFFEHTIIKDNTSFTYELRSLKEPKLTTTNCLYLRGYNKEQDSLITSESYNSIERAKREIHCIKETIEAYNKSLINGDNLEEEAFETLIVE